jgi:hypothetical protein
VVSASGLETRSCPHKYKRGVLPPRLLGQINFRSSATSPPRYIHCVSYPLYKDFIRMLPRGHRRDPVNTNFLSRPALRDSPCLHQRHGTVSSPHKDCSQQSKNETRLDRSASIVTCGVSPEFLATFAAPAQQVGHSGSPVSTWPLAPSERPVCLEDTGDIHPYHSSSASPFSIIYRHVM